MSDRLPPLTALRAFEAAARHMSFAKAADELNVTPAALSFQIKSLEENLGQALFIRLNRAVELTAAGAALAPGATEAFQALIGAWSTARRLSDDRTLTVSAGPAMTAKWLAPRLMEFARSHPDIDLRVSASLRRMDLRRDQVDVAIRFGYEDDDGFYSVPARKEWMSPAMTPAMAELYPTPESLVDAPLIVDRSLDFLNPPCNWESWFRLVGISHNPTQTVSFSNADHAIEAACAGVGVVLGRRPLMIKDVMDRRLVVPFKQAIETDARFRFLCLPGAELRPHIRDFRDWYIDEIEKTSHIWEGMQITPVKDLT
ncbi:MAG: transcriptional regulator GcvA [Cognatishimia sp.]|uniref:transcriptional regulator GcvA n=1 Tax=Cognatishimia sp. TaxID=2211648 RepID=UPI0040589DE3